MCRRPMIYMLYDHILLYDLCGTGHSISEDEVEVSRQEGQKTETRGPFNVSDRTTETSVGK